MEACETNQRVYDAVEKQLGRIAREHFPGMADYWQAEQLVAFDGHRYRLAFVQPYFQNIIRPKPDRAG